MTSKIRLLAGQQCIQHVPQIKVRKELSLRVRFLEKTKIHRSHFWAMMIAVSCLFFTLFLLIPKRVVQPAADLIANQGLSAMLTELGANSFGAVCWLGDRDEQFANQFIGMHESAWSRFKEKMRVDVWTREGSCFESRIKVAVVLFPYVEATRASGLKSDNLSSVIQREMSLLLSQTGPGAEFEKQSTTFHLQTGANFRVYKRRPPMSSPSTQ